MLGGLLGVVFTGDGKVELGGYTLSLAAAAFFVGYSLEVVFSLIETMVDGVAGKLRAAPLPPVQAPMVQMKRPPAPNGQGPIPPGPPQPGPAQPGPAQPGPAQHEQK